MHNLTFFFFNDTATTEIYTLSLHDALPICVALFGSLVGRSSAFMGGLHASLLIDRKSTRLNSSHGYISYAVFCLKKKQKILIGFRVLRGWRLRGFSNTARDIGGVMSSHRVC